MSKERCGRPCSPASPGPSTHRVSTGEDSGASQVSTHDRGAHCPVEAILRGFRSCTRAEGSGVSPLHGESSQCAGVLTLWNSRLHHCPQGQVSTVQPVS